MTRRIAVIGGGITGAFASYFLARSGAEPILIERDDIARHASGRNAGGLNPLHGPGIPGPMAELALQSLRLHLEHWDAIRSISNIDFGGRRVPRLLVAMEEPEAEALAARAELYDDAPGLSARWLSRSAAGQLEPRLNQESLGGLWTEGNARVNPASYTRAVADAAIQLGGRRVLGDASGLRHQSGRVTGVALNGEYLDCDGVVLAPGPWCEAPSHWLGRAIPVEPLKGELLLVRPPDGGIKAEITWRELGAYMADREGVWLGGTEEWAGFDASPSDAGREHILQGMRRLLPRMEVTEVIAHKAALRPVTPDGLPIVGVPSGWENVCLAGGSGRKGMLLAAGMGHAAAELLRSASSTIPLDAFSPDRFGDG